MEMCRFTCGSCPHQICTIAGEREFFHEHVPGNRKRISQRGYVAHFEFLHSIGRGLVEEKLHFGFPFHDSMIPTGGEEGHLRHALRLHPTEPLQAVLLHGCIGSGQGRYDLLRRQFDESPPTPVKKIGTVPSSAPPVPASLTPAPTGTLTLALTLTLTLT